MTGSQIQPRRQEQVFRIFIGWDSREFVAYHVLCHSILSRVSVPVSITPLTQHVLRRAGVYARDQGPTEATEFSMTRFLVPYLSNYEGHSLFIDCDMLVQADITELFLYALAYPEKAIHVCQHDYTPKETTKFLGQVQTAYPRKNWSSVMLFNNAKCKRLTPAYVNAASGLELHRFHWLRGGVVPGVEMVEILPGETDPNKWPADDEMEYIGALPLDWNWLVGEYAANPDAKNLHWTNGGPWFEEYRHVDHADLWLAERDRMLAPSLTQSLVMREAG